MHDYPYKEPWYWVCVESGVHPREATADDILGSLDHRMQHGNGQRVLLASELKTPGGDEEDWNDPLDLGQHLYETEGDIREDLEVTIEVAQLTKGEARVVGAIMNGTPLGHGYADRIGLQLGMSPGTVRVHWTNAKRKLKNDWASDQ